MLYDSDLWIRDVKRAVDAVREIRMLEKKSILITGAAGLICSSVVDMLILYNETHDQKIQILLAGRWEEEMRNRFGSYLDKSYMTFVHYDASSSEIQIDENADYIIHGASNAFPSMIMKQPVETMSGNFIGMKNLLEYAGEHKVKRVLYISSSEVYGRKDSASPFSEDDYGFIDILNPRNSYSVGKRATETLCSSYAAEYGVESVIVRPGHIYGPTASPFDNRVSSAFSYAAAKGENIVLKSDGRQVRSYCYCLDCAAAILMVLLCGENMNAYNISNPDSIISIKDMAQILSVAGGVQMLYEQPCEEERNSFNPMDNSSLCSEKLTGLGWKGLFDANEGLSHTVNIIKEQL